MAISVAAAISQITGPQETSSQRPTAETGKSTASAVEAAFQAGGSRSNRPLPSREKPVSMAQYCSANHSEATATSLGLPLAPMRAGLVAAMALATGTAVSQTGLIAFVGLAAPHLVRSIVRVTHERHIVLASLMGAVLLLAADILSRWVLAPQELPVGVLTAALGGTYLLWLMHRRTASRGASL